MIKIAIILFTLSCVALGGICWIGYKISKLDEETKNYNQ